MNYELKCGEIERLIEELDNLVEEKSKDLNTEQQVKLLDEIEEIRSFHGF